MSTEAFSKEMREKLARVDFGLQVQAFLKSPIGEHLVRRAESDVEEHTQRLKTMDIFADPSAAVREQMEIKCAENFLYWLAEAITTGSQLMEQMLAEERQALGLGGADSQGGDPTGS